MRPHSEGMPNKNNIDKHISNIYLDLQRRIEQQMARSERVNHTLSPADITNEVYIRLLKLDREWQDEKEVFLLAAKITRDVLVDHARRRQCSKRGGGRSRQTYIEGDVVDPKSAIHVLDLNQALETLRNRKPRHFEIVDLHIFCGLQLTEIASMLNIQPDTVSKHWSFARAWLKRALSVSEQET